MIIIHVGTIMHTFAQWLMSSVIHLFAIIPAGAQTNIILYYILIIFLLLLASLRITSMAQSQLLEDLVIMITF